MKTQKYINFDLMSAELLAPEDIGKYEFVDTVDVHTDCQLTIDLINQYPGQKKILLYCYANQKKIESIIKATCFKNGMHYDDDLYSEFLNECAVKYSDFDHEYFLKKGVTRKDEFGNAVFPKLEQYVLSRLKYFMLYKRNLYYKNVNKHVHIDGLTRRREVDDEYFGTITEDRLSYTDSNFLMIETIDALKSVVKILNMLSEQYYEVNIIEYLILVGREYRNTDLDIAEELGVSVNKIRKMNNDIFKLKGDYEFCVTVREYIVALLMLLKEAGMTLEDCLDL